MKKNINFLVVFLCLIFSACQHQFESLDMGFQTILNGDPWFFKISLVSENGWTIVENRGMEAYFHKYKIKTQQLICFDERANKVWEIADFNDVFLPDESKTTIILSETIEIDGKLFVFIADKTRIDSVFSNFRGVFIDKSTGKFLNDLEIKYNLPSNQIKFDFDDFTEKPFAKLKDGRYVIAFYDAVSKQNYIAFFDNQLKSLQSFPTTHLWSAQTTFEQNGKMYSFRRSVFVNITTDFFEWNDGAKNITASKHSYSEVIPLNNNELLVATDGTPAFSRRALEYHLASGTTLGSLIHKHTDVIALNYRKVGEGTANINYRFLEYGGEYFVVYTNFNNDLNILRYNPITKKMDAVYALSSSSPYELLDVEVHPTTGDFYVVANTVVNKTKASLAFFKIRNESLL